MVESYSASQVQDCKTGMTDIEVRAHNSDMGDLKNRSLYWFVVMVYMAVK